MHSAQIHATPDPTKNMLAHAFGTRVAAAASLRRAAFSTQQKIHYTHTDEAPMLATYALLPIIKRFTVPVRCPFSPFSRPSFEP